MQSLLVCNIIIQILPTTHHVCTGSSVHSRSGSPRTPGCLWHTLKGPQVPLTQSVGRVELALISGRGKSVGLEIEAK